MAIVKGIDVDKAVERSGGHNREWTTQDEIRFLSKLGKHGKIKPKKPSRLEYLILYLQASESRMNWDKIDVHAVLDYVEFEIDKIKGV